MSKKAWCVMKLQFNKDTTSVLNVYLDNIRFIKTGDDFLSDESASELRMFTPDSTDYYMSVNTDPSYITEGNYSLKFTAIPRWPRYLFTQEFIDWLKANNIEKISFKLYIDAENSETTVTRTEGIYYNSSPALNAWISVSVNVSSLTGSYIQVNKAAAKSLAFYLDDMQFTYHVHSYTAVVTAPTCTEEGFTTHTCSCGDSYTDSETDALGHDFTVAVEGYNAFACGRDGCEVRTIIENKEEIAILNVNNAENRTSFSTSQQVWEQNGIKLINNKSSSTNNVADYTPPRFYASSAITIQAPGNITKIVFVCNSNSYATALKNSIGNNAVVSNANVTVTLGGDSAEFNVAKLTAQVRMGASITVTYLKESRSICEHTGNEVVDTAKDATCTESG